MGCGWSKSIRGLELRLELEEKRRGELDESSTYHYAFCATIMQQINCCLSLGYGGDLLGGVELMEESACGSASGSGSGAVSGASFRYVIRHSICH